MEYCFLSVECKSFFGGTLAITIQTVYADLEQDSQTTAQLKLKMGLFQFFSVYSTIVFEIAKSNNCLLTSLHLMISSILSPTTCCS